MPECQIERYIGIMSGTSLDGVDVVLCEIDATSCRLVHALEYPMPLALKADILQAISDENSLAFIGTLDHKLGLLFAEAVEALIRKYDIDTSTVTAIGSHGQTLWHQPQATHGFSMQLGDANLLTASTGISVITDFRRKDVALGGQGAPFAPAFHAFIFTEPAHNIAVVNIGGMANITVLDDTLLGYDTGCGNVLMDMWIDKHQNLAYDRDGAWAKSGTLDEALLAQMLEDSYFSLPYPKSTGREKFNASWLDSILSIAGRTIKAEDVQRTLLELTATSIANEVKHFKRDKVLLCGGGAKNAFLVARIQALLPDVEVCIAKDADYIEAMTFAWLAYKRQHKEKVNLKDVTGARDNAILGAIYE